MKRLALVLALALAACSSSPPTTVKSSATNTGSTTTTSSSSTTSTTSTSSTTVPPAPPTTTRTVPPATSRSRLPAPVVDAGFWRRLSSCESSTGRGGNGGGYFQFSGDTASKVGYHAGLSYEQQRALAVKWLGMIHGAGGSRSGWPHCWWVARSG